MKEKKKDIINRDDSKPEGEKMDRVVSMLVGR